MIFLLRCLMKNVIENDLIFIMEFFFDNKKCVIMVISYIDEFFIEKFI